ncbi:MAG: manganese efflux pump MntP family protein [Chloroflexota bacterium]|nr:manganese efflux pump MntP family protein [Chloroflexota bacterium]
MSAPFDARLIPLILSLGLDTFALSTALGVAPLPARTRLRLALTFAMAEGLMPAVGLLLGRPLGAAIGGWALYIAAVLLIGTGVWMLREGLEDDDDDERGGEASKIMSAATARGLPLVGIALSVSLDELAMGFSFGVLRVAVAPALIAIALQALVVSLGGQWIGQRMGAALGERAEVLAGVALCLLGVGFIVARLLGVAL